MHINLQVIPHPFLSPSCLLPSHFHLSHFQRLYGIEYPTTDAYSSNMSPANQGNRALLVHNLCFEPPLFRYRRLLLKSPRENKSRPVCQFHAGISDAVYMHDMVVLVFCEV